MTSEQPSVISNAHQVLASVLHACVGSDPQASPDGFARARELGLIYPAPSPNPTPAGRALLTMIGARS